MNLLGLAIIGKKNEPLYLCDCELGLADETSDSRTDAGDDDEQALHSPRNPSQSLPISKQCMMHTALDHVEEMVGKSLPDGTMPLRQTIHGTAAPSSEWMGLLTTVDGEYNIYGHITATNIKLLALCRKPCKEPPIKAFLAKTHDAWVKYRMNPFTDLEGMVDSRTFDEDIKLAIREYVNTNDPLGNDA